jgi:hypothetical protein
MHRILPAAFIAVGLSCSSFMPALAQEQTPVAADENVRLPDPDPVVDMLASKLALSEAQKSQIKPIIADRQQKISALRADTSLRRGKRLRAMKGVMDDSDQKIKAVLSEQQQAQYAQLEKQMKEQFRQRMR